MHVLPLLTIDANLTDDEDRKKIESKSEELCCVWFWVRIVDIVSRVGNTILIMQI